MSAKRFVREVAKVAKQQERPVVAVDFAPDPRGVVLTFHFKEKP